MLRKLKTIISSTVLTAALALGVVAVLPTANVNAADCDVSVQGGANCAKSKDQKSNIGVVIRDVTNVLLFIIGAVAVIMIIIGGIRYVTSNGDSSQVTAAKNTILYSVIGLIVALLAYAIVNFVVGSFTAGSSNNNGSSASS